jgi:DNA-binding response OmpR family regulator
MMAEDPPLIVIIDDETATVRLLEKYLEMKGFEALVANQAKIGLELIITHVPDAALIDLMLPDMSGFEICERVRATPETADVPVLMLTARTTASDVARGYAAGATRYLKKPLNLSALVDELREIVALGGHAAAASEPPG